MKAFIASVTTALVGLAAAAPQWGNPTYPGQPKVTCLTPTTANNLVTGFAGLLTNYQKANADALLTSDFTDTSDSINILAGIPLGSTTFGSRDDFEAGQSQQPAIGFQVLSIDAITCTEVSFRWVATPNPGSTIKVKGINNFVAKNSNGTDQGWQIETNYSEFNSCAWVQAIGGTCTPPSH